MSEATVLHISRTTSLIVLAGGVVVLLGWATNTQVLYKPTSNAPVITPWTASCFTALGIAIFGQSWRKFVWGRALMALGGAFVIAAMSLTITEYAVGSLRGFDTLLFPGQMATLSMGHPGRPSLQAVLAFLALTFSTLGTLWEDKRAKHGRWIEGLVFVSSSIALLALFGYAFSVPALFVSPELKGGGLSPYSAIQQFSNSVPRFRHCPLDHRTPFVHREPPRHSRPGWVPRSIAVSCLYSHASFIRLAANGGRAKGMDFT